MYENKMIIEINDETVEVNTSPIKENGEVYVHFYSGNNRYCSIIMPEDKIWMKVGYSAEEMDNLFEWLNENRSLLMSMAKGTRPLSFEEADMMASLILAGDDDDEWDEFEDDDLD